MQSGPRKLFFRESKEGHPEFHAGKEAQGDFLLLLTAAVVPRWVGFSFIDIDQLSRKVLVQGGENLSDSFKKSQGSRDKHLLSKGS